jgi:hypothetical protein
VHDGVTGCLLHEQTVDALKAAVQRVESDAFHVDPIAAHAHGQRFETSHAFSVPCVR